MPTTVGGAVRVLHDLADRILAVEIPPRHGLVDDHRARQPLQVAPVDQPAFHQRHLHRLEITRRGGADVGPRFFAVGGGALPSIVNGSAKSMPTGYIGSALTPAADCDAGQRADAANGFHVEARARRRRSCTSPAADRSARRGDCAGSNPGETCISCAKLRVISPAPTSSISASATSTTTSAPRSLRAGSAASRRKTRWSCREARRATPARAGTSAEHERHERRRRSAKSSTPPSSRTSCMRGRLPSGSACTNRTPAHATNRPSVPPIADSSDAFRQDLPHELHPAGAERRAHGDLAAPAREPRQHQVGDVGADDQQQESDGAPRSAAAPAGPS